MDARPALHPTDQTLHAYGLGQLDESSAGSVYAHLEQCLDCRRRVALVSSDSFLDRLCEAGARPGSLQPAVSSTDGSRRRARPDAPPPASTLPPGLADHPDYQVLRELGRGGMGVVYLAQNTLMGRMEVLKVVSGHLINRRGVADRFLGEIRNAARLHHLNIVAAYSAHPPRRDPDPGHGIRRRPRPVPAGQGPRAAAGGPRLLLYVPGGAGPPARATNTAWSTAISSPATSCSPARATERSSRCSTSGWPRSRARGPSKAA